jgi:hypothetical protein
MGRHKVQRLRPPTHLDGQAFGFDALCQQTACVFLRHDCKFGFELCALRQDHIDLFGRRQCEYLKPVQVI